MFGSRKEPKQGGLAFFCRGRRPCGVFRIAGIVRGFGNAGEREARLQSSPDEIKAQLRSVLQGHPSI
jgi:hypothetical protein